MDGLSRKIYLELKELQRGCGVFSGTDPARAACGLWGSVYAVQNPAYAVSHM